MAMHVKGGVEPIASSAGTDRGGSRPKPPKAVTRRASLEATRPMPEPDKANRCSDRQDSRSCALAAAVDLDDGGGLHLRPLGVRQAKAIHGKLLSELEPRPLLKGSPESQQTLEEIGRVPKGEEPPGRPFSFGRRQQTWSGSQGLGRDSLGRDLL
jgi:hypothetical protein